MSEVPLKSLFEFADSAVAENSLPAYEPIISFSESREFALTLYQAFTERNYDAFEVWKEVSAICQADLTREYTGEVTMQVPVIAQLILNVYNLTVGPGEAVSIGQLLRRTPDESVKEILQSYFNFGDHGNPSGTFPNIA